MYSDGADAPFGEPYDQSGTTDLSFTGMNQDTASNLYDFPAREYNGIQSRWPSPDPAGIASANPGDPQTWNRYAYVRNSPLMMTDPTGLEGQPGEGPIECDPDFGCVDCGIDICGGGPSEPQGPVVTNISYSAPPPTTGLPNGGIFATGPGVDYSWLGLLDWAFGFSPVGALNWTGSACDPSVPDCGVTVNCPDEGGPCVLMVGSNTGGAGGSWDTGSAGSSWWNKIAIGGFGRWSGGPAAKFGTRQIPGAGNPYKVSPNPELTPGPAEEPPELMSWWYRIWRVILEEAAGKGPSLTIPPIIIIDPCSPSGRRVYRGLPGIVALCPGGNSNSAAITAPPPTARTMMWAVDLGREFMRLPTFKKEN